MSDKLVSVGIYRLIENPQNLRPQFYVQGVPVNDKLEIGIRCRIYVYENVQYEDHDMVSSIQLENGAAAVMSGDITRPEFTDSTMVFKFLKTN